MFDVSDRVNIVERAAPQIPNMQWKVCVVMNVSYFFPSSDSGGRIDVADHASTPQNLLEKRCAAPFLRARGAATNYDDNFCFFKCLAMKKHCA